MSLLFNELVNYSSDEFSDDLTNLVISTLAKGIFTAVLDYVIIQLKRNACSLVL